MEQKKKNNNIGAGARIAILAAILILLNMLAARFHYGLDLTQEGRFTLTQPTSRLLKGMKDVAVVDVYLEGKKLPAGFQRLRESVRERLQSFKDRSGGRVVFRFKDPFEGVSEDRKKEVYQSLDKKGITGTNLQQNNDEGYSSQIIFPYALVTYKGREQAIPLLENHMGLAPLEKLNLSENALEYKFASAINTLSRADRPRIAYLMGNGEALGINTFDALRTLGGLYQLDTVDLLSGTALPLAYDAAIICKPTIPFDDKTKFKLDQYVMRGGHILWMIDPVHASMDSLATGGEQFVASPYGMEDGKGLHLDDQFFKYGARINTDLIEDLQCNRIPITVGQNSEGQPQIELRGWYYFPVFTPTSRHPIVRNMDAVMSAFTSTIDTIANPEIKKTILLESSQYSRPVLAPARISLSMLRFPPKPELFNKGFRPAAVLLEGKFQSIFTDRLPPSTRAMLDSIKQPFVAAADSPGAMIVISDGDLFLNDFSRREGPMEMGYWQYDRARYANKSFILNCMEYLTDRSGLLEARNKDVRLRLLDAGRIKDERSTWMAVNILVPVGIVLIFASAWIFFRKRRYEGLKG